VRYHLALAVGLILGAGLVGRADEGKGPFADHPVNHWAYDAVTRLAQQGVFTGYPDGTFSGKRALTRYEFAVAIQRMLQEISRLSHFLPPDERPLFAPRSDTLLGALYRAIVRRYRVSTPAWEDGWVLYKLVQEFTPELGMLGLDINRIFPRPLLEPVRPASIPDRPLYESKRQYAGRERARTEWTRGEVCLLMPGSTWGRPDALLQVPCRPMAVGDPRLLEEAAAHDEEVYRLTLERGWPPNSMRRPGVRERRGATGSRPAR
jgi:hypothetical protein